MNSRWTIAALAAVGLGLVAVPFLPWTTTDPAASGPTPAVCDSGAKPAKLDFHLKDVQGKDVDLRGFKGQVVAINFWATWCGPCKYEIPIFMKLQDKYKARGFTVLGLSVADDSPDIVRKYASEKRMNYPVFFASDRDDIQDAYAPLYAIPVTVVVSRDGKACKRLMGFPGEQRFEQLIASLL
jgi:thiol-disulfide isomerase/thioredoxin